MIDIIIPAYNAHETITQTLCSILVQSNLKDINVYIIDDFSDNDYKEEYNFFRTKMNLNLLRLEKNMGPGYARQYGLEHSNSQYVIFIDSDDIFYDLFSIKNLFETIHNNQLDVVASDLMETEATSHIVYTIGFDVLHAKIYRRSFLEENKICFPFMYNSEDLSFNNLVLMSQPKIGYCNDITYVYRRRLNSLTMSSDYNSNKHIKYYIKNLIWTVKKAEENKYQKNEIAKIIIFSFAYLYYYFYNNLNEANIRKIYKLVPLYEKYNNYASEDEKEEQIDFWIERIENFSNEFSFNDFIEKCKQKYYKDNRVNKRIKGIF